MMYNDKELKGSFGAGPDFFECQREGTFAARSADKESVQAFLKILGVSTDAVGK